MSKIKDPSPSGEPQPYQAIARQEHRRASPVFPVFVPTFALRSTHRPVLDLALVEAAGRGLNRGLLWRSALSQRCSQG
jgi:hypothetical protein